MTSRERPVFDDLDKQKDAVVVVGAGIAGLLTAHEIAANTDSNVVVIEKPTPQSNTLVAGQRFRAGIAGERIDGPNEIERLLSYRNEGEYTPRMREFAQHATNELGYWQAQEGLHANDKLEWFGPQWGNANRAGFGRGREVLNWLGKACLERGVYFMTGTVDRLLTGESNGIEGISVTGGNGEQLRVAAGSYVLASGSVGGYVFESTNRSIRKSAHELAFMAGEKLEGATTHMFHPFGKSPDGNSLTVGCYETDNLASVDVFVDPFAPSPRLEQEVTEMLREHQAHYYFPEIIQKFRHFGGVALLKFPNGNQKYVRVAHHQTQIGISTKDGVSAAGADNLYAVGDASTINYWTNHRQRFPGFALTKCLVDARLVSDSIRDAGSLGEGFRITQDEYVSQPPNRQQEQKLRKQNARFLHEYDAATGDSNEQMRISAAWLEFLGQEGEESNLSQREISMHIAQAHYRYASGLQTEPIHIKRENKQ